MSWRFHPVSHSKAGPWVTFSILDSYVLYIVDYEHHWSIPTRGGAKSFPVAMYKTIVNTILSVQNLN
jgi:hypothetical protein